MYNYGVISNIRVIILTLEIYTALHALYIIQLASTIEQSGPYSAIQT